MSGTPDPQEPGGTPPEPQDDDLLDTTLGDLDDDAPPDDQPEDEGGESDPPENPDDEPAPRQSRRQRQYENRGQEVARLRDENAEMSRRLAALEGRQQQQPVDPRAQAAALEAEYERISLLNPVDQVREMHSLMRRESAATAAVAAERQDIAAFAQLQRDEPSARRLAAQVEQTVQQLRSQGINGINREGIYNYLLGQEFRTRGRQQTERQRRSGAANVARQTTRPVNGRSNTGGTPGTRRGDPDAADEALLRGTRVADF